MQIELSGKEFRRLLDMVYIGNWILNSTREENDRIEDYDRIEEKLFALCRSNGMDALCEQYRGHTLPSRAFNDGGIQEAIVAYEDAVFYDILAEELAKRDMGYPDISEDNYEELISRMEAYLDEFDENGADNISVTP